MKKKKIIIIVTILIFLLAIGLIIGFSIKGNKKEEKKNQNIPKDAIEVAQFKTEEEAIKAVQDAFKTDNELRLNKEEEHFWLIDEIQDGKVINDYKVYKELGIINKGNGESPEYNNSAEAKYSSQSTESN